MKKLIILLLIAFTAVLPLLAEEKPIITVLDLETQDMSQNEMRSIISRLSSELFQTDEFIVIDVAERETILNEIKFSMTGCTDSSCQIEVGKMLSAEMIVTGSLAQIGSNYLLSLKLLDTSTTRTVNTADGTYSDLDELVADLQYIAAKLAGINRQPALTLETPAKTASDSGNSRKILKIAAYAAGAAGLISGSVFIYQAVDTYKNSYQPAVDGYYSLDALASAEDYTAASALMESTHDQFMKKVFAGSVTSVAGICCLAGGILLSILPEKDGSSAAVSPRPDGLSFIYRISY